MGPSIPIVMIIVQIRWRRYQDIDTSFRKVAKALGRMTVCNPPIFSTPGSSIFTIPFCINRNLQELVGHHPGHIVVFYFWTANNCFRPKLGS